MDFLEMNKDLRLRKCSYCGRARHDKDALFCTMCGVPIVNFCLECSTRNQAIARFCGKCGHKTIFFEKNILPAYGTEIIPSAYHQPPSPPEGRFSRIERLDKERAAKRQISKEEREKRLQKFLEEYADD